MKLISVFFLLCPCLYAQDQKEMDREAVRQAVLRLEGQIVGKEKEPSESVYKNIRTLKGLPAGRLLKIMEFGFSQSLGVGCDHCHNLSAWDKDDKAPKEIARKMWTMAENIRQELHIIVDNNATINCTTCHRGNIVPATSLKE